MIDGTAEMGRHISNVRELFGVQCCEKRCRCVMTFKRFEPFSECGLMLSIFDIPYHVY